MRKKLKNYIEMSKSNNIEIIICGDICPTKNFSVKQFTIDKNYV